MPEPKGLCQNCYPRWADRAIALTPDRRCAYCGRHVDSDFYWGDVDYAIGFHARSQERARLRRLLGVYETLEQLGSPVAPLLLKDLKDGLAELERLEAGRTVQYEPHPAPSHPELGDAERSQDFEDWWQLRNAGVVLDPFVDWLEKKKAPPEESDEASGDEPS